MREARSERYDITIMPEFVTITMGKQNGRAAASFYVESGGAASVRRQAAALWLLSLVSAAAAAAAGGNSWSLIVRNAGVSAMHMTLTHRNTVIMFDRTDYGPSQLRLPSGRCRHDPADLALKVDCFAHSIELSLRNHLQNFSVRPLEVLSDTWCSSGAFTQRGLLLSTGGYNDGATAVRRFLPCSDASCDWDESSMRRMSSPRWYSSNQILPDGDSVIVVGGRNVFSFEFVPSSGNPPSPFSFLLETHIPGVENNLYPFLHLSSDGNLFVFADRKSILLDYRRNKVVRRFPDMPGGGRNYPSSGSSVMLPLTFSDGFRRVEILVCGGAPDGSYRMANAAKGNKMRVEALTTCGRMVITEAAAAAKWAMEEMPTPRVMGDMLILPTGEVLIINGAKRGTAGWGNADDPNLVPLLYKPEAAEGRRFEELAASGVPRLYHSTANLLPDGTILVGGSNPNVGYAFEGVEFKTELRLEIYHPYYVDPSLDGMRPAVTGLSRVEVRYGEVFTVAFSLPEGKAIGRGQVEVRVYAPPFTTHSYSMNQRQLLLASSAVKRFGPRYYTRVAAPPSGVAAPPGFYVLFLLHQGVPSAGTWIRFA